MDTNSRGNGCRCGLTPVLEVMAAGVIWTPVLKVLFAGVILTPVPEVMVAGVVWIPVPAVMVAGVVWIAVFEVSNGEQSCVTASTTF